MIRKTLSNKIIVLGVDGMEPRTTKRLMDEGRLPNIKKIVENGAQREDLVMLGAHPTVTPPLWATLATGAYPRTHGLTCFWNQSHEDLDTMVYAMDSRRCKAEPLWNVFAAEGKKTLVWHWPGGGWPPTSDSPNLHVVDGTQPCAINLGHAGIDWEKLVVASSEFKTVKYQPYAVTDTGAGCVITDVDGHGGNAAADNFDTMNSALIVKNIMLSHEDGDLSLEKLPLDLVNSPIKDPAGWENAPMGSKEFTIITSSGFVRRPALILQNEAGEFDKVAIYKSKNELNPFITLCRDELSPLITDEIKVEEKTIIGARFYKLLEIADDGSKVRLWMSNAFDIDNDEVWYPKSIYKDVVENVGYVPPVSMSGGNDVELTEKTLIPTWEKHTKWQAEAMNYLIEKENYEIVFSHLHNVDSQGHLFWQLAKTRDYLGNNEKIYQKFIEDVYIDTDRYMGKFLHLLDKGWSVIITSDHGLLVSDEHPPLIGDPFGVNVRVMEQLGYTSVKKDENGNDLKEIDWEKTKAIATRSNHIWINLIGRNKTGIVKPEEYDDLVTKIIDDLYNYRDPATGKRVISLAFRNKDAEVIGLGGPECGDIIIFLEEGYNRCHGDALSTVNGYFDTTVSPLFIAAGQGLKKGFYTDRVIRQVDVAPTIAILGGVRMPAQCEGAPIYQIFEEEF
ncbi:MAG: alkaline phosphatase family protein [Dehalobacterium sp.]